MADKKPKNVSETHKIKDGVKRLLWHLSGSIVLFTVGGAIAVDAYLHGDPVVGGIALLAMLCGAYWIYRTNNEVTDNIHDSTKAFFLMKA
jgi:hypothetical protein